MRKTFGIKILIFGFILLQIAGCRYSVRTNLPSYIHSIKVEQFVNHTGYRDLEIDLRKAILKEFKLRNVKVNPRKYNAIISGDIIKYEKCPLKEDILNRVIEAQVIITASIRCYDIVKERWVVNNIIVSNADVDNNSGICTIDSYGKGEDKGKDDAINDLANSIVRIIYQNW